VAWIKADGDVAHVEPFIRAAEHLSDTFLPVGELQQATVPGIFRVGDPGVLAAASAWIASARRNALDRLPGAPIPAAGVYLCSRLPPGADEEAFALRLLGEDGVLVHPGFYYDLPGWAVFTCLAEAGALEAAIQSLANCTKRVATGKGTAPA